MITADTSTLFEGVRVTLSNKKRLEDATRLRRTYERAAQLHAGQTRLSGDEYITHPLAVAQTVASLGLDQATVEAALLHDTIEDTDYTTQELREEFGPDVAEIVDGVTKLGQLDLGVTQERYTENLRKMFLAMAQDIRVVILKLADRVHNMQTLDALPRADQLRIAKETMDIYAPLANRLGMGEVKATLEDLAFSYLEPRAYRQIEDDLQRIVKERETYVQKMEAFLTAELKEAGIRAQIEGRPKHVYSIYKKLRKTDQQIGEIYDLLAIRIIVWRVEECYKVLGIIHSHFKPLIYRIKDYIAVPKPNGYQSLHTTVFGLDGVITEIQIRTAEMHQHAERGVAAHFHYDEEKMSTKYAQGESSTAPSKKLGWVNQLMDWQTDLSGGSDFVESLKIDVFRDRIFCFTPKGDVYDLPEGATPVDFAYAVHTEVGHGCAGALVNGKMVPLDTRLENRDIVQIVTQKSGSGPSRDWLKFARTTSAKSRIRAFFKALDRDKNVIAGRAELEAELRRLGKPRLDKLAAAKKASILDHFSFKTIEDLLAQVGEGQITAAQVMRRLYTKEELGLAPAGPIQRKATSGSATNLIPVVAGEPTLVTTLAKCCDPQSGDRIVGVITKRPGITIHRQDCAMVGRVDRRRVVAARWQSGVSVTVRLQLTGTDRVGLLRDVTSAVAEQGINIHNMQSTEAGRSSQLTFGVEIESVERLTALIRRLERVNGVQRVRRVKA